MLVIFVRAFHLPNSTETINAFLFFFPLDLWHPPVEIQGQGSLNIWSIYNVSELICSDRVLTSDSLPDAAVPETGSLLHSNPEP